LRNIEQQVGILRNFTVKSDYLITFFNNARSDQRLKSALPNSGDIDGAEMATAFPAWCPLWSLP
jgi:hypothetical protein